MLSEKAFECGCCETEDEGHSYSYHKVVKLTDAQAEIKSIFEEIERVMSGQICTEAEANYANCERCKDYYQLKQKFGAE
jgi:cell fate (sporulation/competence/biofilm development) regulator YlbF (YheA/YmcA/DUF963 family)